MVRLGIVLPRDAHTNCRWNSGLIAGEAGLRSAY
jgi:hypothetical protein